MRVLVTGGAGYIGSHTVRALISAGHTVVVADDLSTGYRSFVPRDVSFYPVSVTNSPGMAQIMCAENIDAVIHFAAKCLVGDDRKRPASYIGSNVEGTVAVLNAMTRTGVRKIVFSSSCVVYGSTGAALVTEDLPLNPINIYGETKLAMEAVIRAYASRYEIAYAALRYFNASGASNSLEIGEWHSPETHLIPRAIQAALGSPGCDKEIAIYGEDFETPDGTPIRDYVHVDDLADAHIRALELNESFAVNLGTGRGHSVREILSIVEKIAGRAVPSRSGPRREGDPARLVASNRRAAEILKWKPKKGIEEIIDSAVSWERERIKLITGRKFC